MAKYVGLWHGGNSYSQGEWATDAEVFNSLEHAKDTIRERFHGGYMQGTYAVEWADDGLPYVGNYLDNHRQGYYPAVDHTCSLLLVNFEYADLESLEAESLADYLLTIGPKGGIKTTKL